MSLGIKVAAMSGVTAGLAITAVELLVQAVTAASSPGITGSPVVDGVLGGGAVGGALWLYLVKRIDDKADKSSVDEMRKDIREIRQHLMGDR
jgi:hypothetical protein